MKFFCNRNFTSVFILGFFIVTQIDFGFYEAFIRFGAAEMHFSGEKISLRRNTSLN